MTHTYEFVIAAVKDNDCAVNSDGSRPRLPESLTCQHCFNGHSIAHRLLHQTFGSKIMANFVGFTVVVPFAFAFALPVSHYLFLFLFPFPAFFIGIIGGAGIEVDAAVD